jgi:hypothetical protein
MRRGWPTLLVAILGAIGGVLLAAQTRDSAAPVAGTAIITGTVVTDDVTPRPLGRAIVTVTGGDLPATRSAITDDDGRFVIRMLPAGRVTITATKHGYVAGTYGAIRPGRPGTPVQIAPGGTFDVTIRMTPTGVVTGVIRDERGEPMAGLRVFAIDARTPVAPDPPRDGSPGVGVETDDRGSYRIFDLVPGTYLIAATPIARITGNVRQRSVDEIDQVLAKLQAHDTRLRAAADPTLAAAPVESTQVSTLAPVFFPGTSVMADATRITLVRGDVRDGLDFVMRPVPVTTIDGVVISTEGPLPSNVQMRIVSSNTLHFFGLGAVDPQFRSVLTPEADGRFTFRTIVPGHYSLVASASNLTVGSGGGGVPAAGRDGQVATGSGPAQYAIEEIDVAGQPVSGVTLRLQRGSRVSGRIEFDAPAGAAPVDLGSVQVSLVATGSPVPAAGLWPARLQVPVRADGSFEISGVAPGRYGVQATAPSTNGTAWWLRSAIVSGRDVLDSSLEVVIGADVSNAALTLTDRRSDLSGTLQTASGVAAPDYFVIAFPADPALRTSGSRRLKATRPATDGRFSFADLPPGDYLLVALTDVEPDEWQQPDFLATIAPHGLKVTLGLGERKTQDLRIGGGGGGR